MTTNRTRRQVVDRQAAVEVVRIYTRIFEDDEGNRDGVEAQEQKCLREADRQAPGAPVHVYSDNDISASKGLRRPDLERLVADLRCGGRAPASPRSPDPFIPHDRPHEAGF